MSLLTFFNLLINSLVILVGLWMLYAPIPRRILRNGRTPILHMVRTFGVVLVLQAGVRIAVEAFEPSMELREVLRLVIGLISLAAVVALARFLRWMVERALAVQEERS